jgi:hypothetical protein
MQYVIQKSYVQAHERKLKSGQVVQIQAHYDKRTKKHTEHAPDHGHDVSHLSGEEKDLFNRMHREQHFTAHYHATGYRKIAKHHSDTAAKLESEAAEHEKAGRKKRAASVRERANKHRAKVAKYHEAADKMDKIVEGIGALKEKMVAGSGKLAHEDTEAAHAHYAAKAGARFKTLAPKPTESAHAEGDKWVMPVQEAIAEHKELVHAAETPTKADDKAQLAEQKAELARMEKKDSDFLSDIDKPFEKDFDSQRKAIFDALKNSGWHVNEKTGWSALELGEESNKVWLHARFINNHYMQLIDGFNQISLHRILARPTARQLVADVTNKANAYVSGRLKRTAPPIVVQKVAEQKAELARMEDAPPSLSEAQRKSIERSNSAWDAWKSGVDTPSRAAFREQARSGKLDHLYALAEEDERRINAETEQRQAETKQRQQARNDAWRERNLPRLAAAKKVSEDFERQQQAAKVAAVKERLDAEQAKKEAAAAAKKARAEQVSNAAPAKRTLPKTGRVSNDDPSVWGSWLLGHEGESWAHVRTLAPARLQDNYSAPPIVVQKDVAEQIQAKNKPAVDAGPKEGERNAEGLVFRDGRWRREEPAAESKPKAESQSGKKPLKFVDYNTVKSPYAKAIDEIKQKREKLLVELEAAKAKNNKFLVRDLSDRLGALNERLELSENSVEHEANSKGKTIFTPEQHAQRNQLQAQKQEARLAQGKRQQEVREIEKRLEKLGVTNEAGKGFVVGEKNLKPNWEPFSSLFLGKDSHFQGEKITAAQRHKLTDGKIIFDIDAKKFKAEGFSNPAAANEAVQKMNEWYATGKPEIPERANPNDSFGTPYRSFQEWFADADMPERTPDGRWRDLETGLYYDDGAGEKPKSKPRTSTPRVVVKKDAVATPQKPKLSAEELQSRLLRLGKEWKSGEKHRVYFNQVDNQPIRFKVWYDLTTNKFGYDREFKDDAKVVIERLKAAAAK